MTAADPATIADSTAVNTFPSVPTAPEPSPAVAPLPEPGSPAQVAAAATGERAAGDAAVRMATRATRRGPDGIETPVGREPAGEKADPPVVTVGLPEVRWTLQATARNGLVHGLPDLPVVEAHWHGPPDRTRWERAMWRAIPHERIAAARARVLGLESLHRYRSFAPQLRDAEDRRLRAAARLEALKAQRRCLELDPPAENAAAVLRENAAETERAEAEVRAATEDCNALAPLKPRLEEEARRAVEKAIGEALSGWEAELEGRYERAKAEYEATCSAALENLVVAFYGTRGVDPVSLTRELATKAMNHQPFTVDVAPLPVPGRSRQTPG